MLIDYRSLPETGLNALLSAYFKNKIWSVKNNKLELILFLN